MIIKKLYIQFIFRSICIPVFLVLVCLRVHSQDFEFAYLRGVPINTSGWNLQGNAKVGNSPGSSGDGEIILTEPVNTQSGAIFFNTPINLSQCKKWIAEFDFRIGEGTVADGLAFCYLDVPPSGFISGGGIGIPASANGLKVVIDTWLNCGTDRVPKLQIRWGAGYDECNGQPTRSNNDGTMNFLRSPSYQKCRIEYNEGNIKVLVNGIEYLTAFQTFNFTGYFGFTASTGGSNDRHSIKNVRIFTEMPPSQAGMDKEICTGGSASIGGPGTAGYSYRWIPSTGLSSDVVSNPFVGLSNTGETDIFQQYIVETSFTNKPGCSSKDSVQVKVMAKPLPAFFHDTLCLPGAAIELKNISRHQALPASGLTWYWNFGDPASGSANTSTEPQPTHFYNSIGPYTVTFAATTAKGCTDTLIKNITPLVNRPSADFSISHSTCLADSARFTSNAAASLPDLMVQWEWFFGDNQKATGINSAHKYGTAGSFEVKHIATSSRGCMSDTVRKNIVVNPKPVAAFILNGPFCQNRLINVSNTSSTKTGIIKKWYWQMGNGQVFDRTSGESFTYAYPVAGTYRVKLVVTTEAGCQSDTATQTIIVGHVPVPDFDLPDVCLNDAFAEFINTTTIADGTLTQVTWLWNFGDPDANAGNPNTSTQMNAKHRYTAARVYPVKLFATSNLGCSDSLTINLTVNGDKPQAIFNVVNTGSICSNLPVQVQNKSTVNFGTVTRVIVYWNFGGNKNDTTRDDKPSFDKIYQKTYSRFASPASKKIEIRLKAYSGIVCVNETAQTITLHAAPDVRMQTIPGICLDASSRLINQGYDAGNNPGTGIYSGPGIQANGLFNPVVTGAGTFTVRYQYLTTSGCTDSAQGTITVWPRPTAIFSNSAITCVETPVTFTDASLANANKLVKWQWSFGDGTSQTLNNSNPFSRTFSNVQNYTISLVVTTDSGCVSTPLAKVLNMQPKPLVNFNTPQVVCLPEGKATFNNLTTVGGTGGTPITWLWNFGLPGAKSTLENPTYFYPAVGPYTVQLKATSAMGCIDSMAKVFNTVYPQPMANWSANPPGVCLGDDIQFTDLSNPLNNTIVAWTWQFGDGGASQLQNPVHVYATAGSFKASLFYTTAIGCKSDTLSKEVVIHPYPVVNAGPDLFLLQGGQVTLRASATGSTNYTFLWTPGTWLSNPAILQPISKAEDDITYLLTVTGEGGCETADEIFVKLLLKPFIPNVFSPNGDGINDTWVIRYLDSYPGATVQIFDRYGKRIFMSSGYNNPWNGTMGGNPVPAGVYYYIVEPKNGLKPINGSLTIVR